MPRFKNDTTYIVPNIGVKKRTPPQQRGRLIADLKTHEELRLKKKFMTVKA